MEGTRPDCSSGPEPPGRSGFPTYCENSYHVESAGYPTMISTEVRRRRISSLEAAQPWQRSTHLGHYIGDTKRALPLPQASRARIRWASCTSHGHCERSHHMDHEGSATPTFLHSRTNSDDSTVSLVGTKASTSIYSIPRSSSDSPVDFSMRASSMVLPSSPQFKERLCLLHLPQSLLERICACVLGPPCNISLGPQQAPTRCERHRQTKVSLDHVDIRLFMMRPIFTVSKELRTLALKVFRAQNSFVIDLTQVEQSSRASSDSVHQLERFWINATPKSIRDTLSGISKLQVRIPVPCSDTVDIPGSKNHETRGGMMESVLWFEHIVTQKRNIVIVQRCLLSIAALIAAGQAAYANKVEFGKTWPTNYLVSASTSIPRRLLVKRLQIIYIKRSPSSVVLCEALDLLSVWQRRRLSRSTEYFLELEGRKRLWATQKNGKWQGRERTGAELLRDLQALVVPPPTLPNLSSQPMRPIRPTSRPQQIRFPTVTPARPPHSCDTSKRIRHDREATALLQSRGSRLPSEIIFPVVTASQREMQHRFEKMNEIERMVFGHSGRTSSVGMSKQVPKDISLSDTGNKQNQKLKQRESKQKERKKDEPQVPEAVPPSVQELQKIVADVRRDLY